MKRSSTIFVGGPDRHALSAGVRCVCDHLGVKARVNVAGPDEPTQIEVELPRHEARTIASRARKLIRNADAHCTVRERGVA